MPVYELVELCWSSIHIHCQFVASAEGEQAVEVVEPGPKGREFDNGPVADILNEKVN